MKPFCLVISLLFVMTGILSADTALDSSKSSFLQDKHGISVRAVVYSEHITSELVENCSGLSSSRVETFFCGTNSILRTVRNGTRVALEIFPVPYVVVCGDQDGNGVWETIQFLASIGDTKRLIVSFSRNEDGNFIPGSDAEMGSIRAEEKKIKAMIPSRGKGAGKE